MLGNMMTMPLTITSIMRHAQRVSGNVEVISVNLDKSQHRYHYHECFQRAAQLANAFTKAGMQAGDRVATLAWNDHYHLEAYYAVSCSGAICHTINPRLHPDQINEIMKSADDRFLLISADLYKSLAEQLALAGLDKVIVYQSSEPPETANAIDYEEFIAGQNSVFDWPVLDENEASGLCYTSGTTGMPKGALYSHRSTVLHSYAMCLSDSLNLSATDTIMPIVPMFHVNAWGIPYAAPMMGSRLILPGRFMGDGELLTQLIEEHQVTAAAGVPTAWMNVLGQLDQSKKDNNQLSTLRMIVIGGAAASAKLMQELEAYGPKVRIAWGMTETSPLGCVNITDSNADIGERLKAGKPVFGVEFRIVDDNGEEQPWDGESSGHLEVRGNWVCRRYYHQDTDNWDNDGWFNTGDVATIDPQSRVAITDRSKDLIKSGGEWISSIELENIASSHPDIHEAAVISLPDPQWDERPALIVVPDGGKQVDTQALLAFYEGKVAKWWIPDRVIIVEELPHTATGKLDKKVLRKQYEST